MSHAYRINWMDYSNGSIHSGMSHLSYEEADAWVETLNRKYQGKIGHWMENVKTKYLICRLIISENVVEKGASEYSLNQAKEIVEYLNYKYKKSIVHWFVPIAGLSYHPSYYEASLPFEEELSRLLQ